TRFSLFLISVGTETRMGSSSSG
ncbi:MAG: hypothetical protein K0S37_1676, partial [Microbacterium sp.]|nr:hypothetical protein [Microbacterium sp.]